MNLRLTTLEVARGYLGVRERGGENRGPEVTEFLRRANIHVPAPWCAAYVNTCAEIGAEKLGVLSPLEEVPLQAYVQSYYQHFSKLGFIVEPHEVMPGDLFVLWYPHLKRYGHIGFVKDIDVRRNRYTTIEGNTNAAGSREGDGVYSKTRHLGSRVKFIRWTRVVKYLAR